MNFARLTSEVTNDPLEREYAGMTDSEVAARGAVKDRTRDVTSISGQDLFEAVDPEDFANLTDSDKATLFGIIGMGTILVNGANTKAALLSVFGSGTQTRINLAALQTETIDRWTELGLGDVKPGHVQNARM